MGPGGSPKRLLLVDSRINIARTIEGACGSDAAVDTTSDFMIARRKLLDAPPDLLVTSVRLGAYNGLHLIYLSMTTRAATRSVVYSTYVDLTLVDEVQRIGAFYELETRLPYAIPRYLTATLPPFDRRSALGIDRRGVFRGGRRATDASVNVV
jgi:DNA-binding NtrC family response regulator